jgi:D-lyxose ketol-isomerase
MLTRSAYRLATQRASTLLAQSGIAVRPEELLRMEVADFGLGELESSGAQILTLVETSKVAAKILVLFAGQTVPEHTHPRLGDYPGKEETIRCQWGQLDLYTSGEPTPTPSARPPDHRRQTYTVWHECILLPGDQVTLPPNRPHWFQGGPQGAVIWSFSTPATDIADVFTDPDVIRTTVVLDG